MKKLGLFIVALIFAAALTACGSNSSKNSSTKEASNKKDTIEIKSTYQVMGEKEDGSDAKKVTETVNVPKNPENIAVFDYGTLSTMQELDAVDSVKGLPKGEGSRSLPSFLKTFKADRYKNLGNLKEPAFEKLAEINPELIIISGRQANQKTLDEMKKAAPDAVILYMGTNEEDYIGSVKENTKNLGKIFDKEEKANELIDELDQKIEEVQKMTAQSKDKALFVLANEGELSVFGKGGRFGFIHDVLGVKEADKNIKAEGHGQIINFEYLNKTNPDIIYAMDRGVAVGGKSSSKQTLSNEVIENVNAIKSNQVIELDPYLWYFSSGGVKTTVQQIEEVEKAYQ